MIRIFLDANVLFAAAASPEGGSAKILEGCRKGVWEAVVSRLVLLEAERNIRNKLSPSVLTRYHRMLEATPFHVVPGPVADKLHPYRALINEKDLPILGAAITSGASFLVTLDRKDFMTPKLRAASLPLRIVTPKEFFEFAMP
jgi:predicted nucleic acid-binding protein